MPFSAAFPLLLATGSGAFTLEQLFQQLSYGELSNQPVAVEATGILKKDQQNRIVFFLNEALTRLHSRFALLEESETLELTAGEDLDHELEEDVIIVTSMFTVVDEVTTSITFNVKPIPGTLYVHAGSIHVPERLAEYAAELQVNYQKRHPVIESVTVPSDLGQEITLIPELREALTAYIAAKFYGSMNSQDTLAIAAGYRQRYEQVIQEASQQGVLPGELVEVQKLEMRGFV